MKYLSLGYDNKGIAGMMGISPRTVEFHLNSIKDKISITSRTQILDYLHRLGDKTQLR